jgi:hypothetical protein
MNRIASLSVAAVVLGLLCGVAQANLLLNSGYESAVMLSWSPDNETTNWFGWGDVEAVGSGWKTPHSGSQTLVLKNWLGGADGVEQKPTVTGNLGYDFSFYSLYDGGFDGSLSVQIRWLDSGGTQIGSNSIAWNQGAGDTWNLTYVQITSLVSSARAEINFGNSGGTAGALYLDDVNFAAIPEPTTAALLGFMGLGMLALRRFKR